MSGDAEDNFREWLIDAIAGDPEGLFNIASAIDDENLVAFRTSAYRLSAERGSAEAAVNLALDLDDAGDADGARVFMQRAWSLGERVQAPLWLGYDREQDEDFENAVAWYLRSEDSVQGTLGAARALREMGRGSDADDVLFRRLDSDASIAAEWAVSAQSSLTEKIERLERMVADGDFQLLIPLANLLADAGNFDRAIELLRRSADMGEPNARHNLGVTLWEAGRAQEAIDQMTRAAADGDDNSTQWLLENG